MNEWSGKLAYASLFTVVLPAALVSWAARLDRLLRLPVVGESWMGIALTIAAALFILAAVVTLRREGGGWPMSPYPPPRFVAGGPYAVVADPIYVGCVALSAGLALWLRSAAGLWIVTPALALACMAFVIGYERPRTVARFGAPERPPLIRVPRRSDEPADLGDRASIYLAVLLPWLVAFEAVNALGAPHDARSGWLRWDALVPLIGWTELLYFADYALVLAVPLIARTKRQLHDFAVQGWVATTLITIVYLTVPVILPPKPAPAGSVFAPLMTWERSFDNVLTAMPAFHVVWAFIAAGTFAAVWPRLRPLWWSVAAAIALSCLTTGMHGIADVVAGLIAAGIVVHCRRIWRLVLDVAEGLANSWREWQVGPIRLMSHGLYAAVGAFLGIVIVSGLTGHAMRASLIALAIITGAGLWAQWIEGSPQLLRPFGYYGGIIGACLAIAILPDAWLMLAGYAVAATIVQAFGRCRCLIQGCCHGAAAPGELGIRYVHPRSRVTRLSDLGGRSVHATQLYSIAGNALLFVLLLRLWFVGAPLPFIAGVYFMFSGLERFVEEHYRGEPQTPERWGFRLYQWLALGSFTGGAVLTTFAGAAAPSAEPLGGVAWAMAAVVGLVTYVAYGVDFPRLNTRFARLV